MQIFGDRRGFSSYILLLSHLFIYAFVLYAADDFKKFVDVAVDLDAKSYPSLKKDKLISAIDPSLSFYSIAVKVRNEGNSPAENIKIDFSLPIKATVLEQTMQPVDGTAESICWSTTVPPRSDTTINVSLFGRFNNGDADIFRATVFASDDVDLSNNSAEASIAGIDNEGTFQPGLEIAPLQADVSDSIWLHIKFPVRVILWDILVQLPNGDIIDNFADAFIARTFPEPGIWYAVDEPFLFKMIVGGGSSDEIIFKVTATAEDGSTGETVQIASIKSNLALALPNVVSPESESIPIDFIVPGGHVQMNLYDAAGRFITGLIDDSFEAGQHTYIWNGMTEQGALVGSGVYLITMNTETDKTWKKLIIVR